MQRKEGLMGNGSEKVVSPLLHQISYTSSSWENLLCLSDHTSLDTKYFIMFPLLPSLVVP